MKQTLLVAAAATTAIVAPSFAQGSWYVSGGYTYIDADNDGELGAITLRGGHSFNEVFSAEIEGSFGVADEEQFGVTTEISHAVGAFGVAKLPVTEQFDLFGRLGYADVEFDVSGNGFDSSVSDDGFAYGVGGQYFVGNHGVRAGYTAYDLEETIDTFEVSYVYRF